MINIDLLKQLAPFQSLEVAPDIGAILQKLQQPLAKYAELEFRSDGKRIDLITLSKNIDDIEQFIEFLQNRGNSSTDCETMLSLSRFGAGYVMGMKLPVAGSVMGGEMYLRGAIPISEVQFFLKQRGVNSQTLDTIGTLGDIFDKEYTHFIATDVGSPSSWSIFFTTYLSPETDNFEKECLKNALEFIGIEQEGLDQFIELHLLLGTARPETLYFSFNIFDGQILQRAKIDYVDVRIGLLSEIMAVTGNFEPSNILLKWSTQLNVKTANYAGLIINNKEISGVRAYFTQK